MSVAVSRYCVGKADSHLHNIKRQQRAHKNYIKWYKRKENNGHELQVVLPMFQSITDDIELFIFEGKVDSLGNEYYIININDDTGTRSFYTRNNSSTDSMRGIWICHSVIFNVLGNAAQMYATVYGISKEELPSTSCLSGVFLLLSFLISVMEKCRIVLIKHWVI